MDIDNVAQIIAACCVLHNLCEIHHDSFNEKAAAGSWVGSAWCAQHINI